MKKVLFVSLDCGNPVKSGYFEAATWANSHAPKEHFITSHLVGTRINSDQKLEEVYAYEVCVQV